MKKLIIQSLITVLALGGAVTVYAEDSGSVQVNTSATVNTGVNVNPIKAAVEANKETRIDTRAQIQDIRTNMATGTASSTQERREDRKEIIKLKIESRFKQMFVRLQATIDRETIIMGRINSRIAKIKAAGGTGVTEAEKLVVDAKLHIDAAQTALNLLKSTATSDTEINAQVTASTTIGSVTRATLLKMQKAGQDVEKHLRAAHQDLMKTVGVLRGNSQVNASTTTSVNTQN